MPERRFIFYVRTIRDRGDFGYRIFGIPGSDEEAEGLPGVGRLGVNRQHAEYRKEQAHGRIIPHAAGGYP